MNLQISRAPEVPATWSDLPLPPGREGVLGPPGGRRGRSALPLRSHTLCRSPGSWGVRGCLVRLAYAFSELQSPAPWYLQQSRRRWALTLTAQWQIQEAGEEVSLLIKHPSSSHSSRRRYWTAWVQGAGLATFL